MGDRSLASVRHWRPNLNISSVGTTAVSSYRPSAPAEAAEGPGPDHDGDADDKAVAASTKASLPQGVGQRLDMSV